MSMAARSRLPDGHFCWRIISGAVFFPLIVCAVLASPAKGNEAAVEWLLHQQHDDGRFASSSDESLPYHSTSESLRALRLPGRGSESAQAGGLGYLDAASVDGALPYLSRVLIARRLAGQSGSDEVEAVLIHQNEDGGFGGRPGDQSSVLDTLDALEALAVAGVASGAVIQPSIAYLLQRQHADGSFSATSVSLPSFYLTSRALSVLQPHRFDYNLSAPLQRAADFLWNNQEQGLWGEIWESAEALLALIPLTTDTSRYDAALNQLLARQGANGSWDGSVLATALALRAIEAPRAVTSPPVPRLAAIGGRVLDDSTGVPLNGVMVTAAGDDGSSITLPTGTDGRFTLEDLEPQGYTVSYGAAGYAGYVQSISLQAGQFLDLGAVRLPAAPQTALISGRLSDAGTGSPVTATIGFSGDADVSVSTGMDGRYAVTVSPGLVHIQVVAPGYHSVNATATVQAGQRVEFSPALHPDDGQVPDGPVSITGTIVDVDTGLAMEGVSVTLKDGTAAAATDGAGVFVLGDLEAGELVLHVTREGYQSVAVNLVAVPGSQVTIGTLHLIPLPDPATTLHGRVYDVETDLAVAGATVTVGGLSSSTDESGQYQITDIESLAFEVSASAVGYLSGSNGFVLQQHGVVRLDIPLQKAATDGIGIVRVVKDRVAYEAFDEVLVSAEVENEGDESQRVVMAATVLGINNDLREDFVIPVPGGPRDARFDIDPGELVTREFTWSPGNWPPGDYRINVQVLTEHRDVLLSEEMVLIRVVETSRLRSLGIHTVPTQVIRGEEVEVEFLASLENLSNVDSELTFDYALIDPDGNVVHQGDAHIPVMAAASSSLVSLGTITQAFEEAGSYPIQVVNVLGMTVSSVRTDDLIVPPNIRIEGHLGAEPESITPGESKGVRIRLRIEGVEDSP
ncbi:carboxypeptidase regulatory-like domain-containing protein [Thioalkalivibrio thiocyanodenitrificans]|uniref:carboxypeptidase regulatory-like domain-containing protein n=1 Tax=Thioalkalivibrio thiocyanodenitrificans TaxID=243063 RepID=UPI0003AB1DC7|nr:carboxypeptidase regulatory-like domain-containing protein [Thioalkalivibrio thiocyanodenitrificans]